MDVVMALLGKALKGPSLGHYGRVIVSWVHFTCAGFNGLLRFSGMPKERQSPRLVAANRRQVLPRCPFEQRIAVRLKRALRVPQCQPRSRAFEQPQLGEPAESH
jgi:hypothetical protein